MVCFLGQVYFLCLRFGGHSKCRGRQLNFKFQIINIMLWLWVRFRNMDCLAVLEVDDENGRDVLGFFF